jgi:hypothetical protein
MSRHRIDTHSHFVPAFYRDELEANGHAQPDGMPAVPVSSHGRGDIKALLSCSSNGPNKPTWK